MDRITYYHVLGVSSDASDDEILAAFRRRVKEWHPDICDHSDAEERMREINRAAEVLCDPERRKRYDLALAGKITSKKEQIPQTRATGSINSSMGDISALMARVVSPFKVWMRPETRRFATVILLSIIVLLGILTVPYFANPFAAPEISPVQGETAGVPLPETSPVNTAGTGIAGQHAGDTLLEQGNYSGALAAYDAIISDNPGISQRDIWYNRGRALQALGLYAEAAESFDRALQASPDDSLALAQKGAALLGLGRFNESLEYSDRALAISPEIAWIWSNRGTALENLGDIEEAQAAFERAGIPRAASGDAFYRNIVISQGVVFSL